MTADNAARRLQSSYPVRRNVCEAGDPLTFEPQRVRPAARNRRLWLLTLMCLWAVPPARAQEPAPAQKGAQLTILQINDVYETVPVDGLGGLARVATLKQNVARAGSTPVLVLAGDFLPSSVASSIFQGEQMIAAFDAMGLDLATLAKAPSPRFAETAPR